MRGGFEQILKLFVGAILDADGQKVKVSMRHVWLLLEFLSKTMPLWQKQFSCWFIPKLRFAFKQAMVGGAVLIKFHKDNFSGAHKALNTILKRYYTSVPSTNEAAKLTIDDNYHSIAPDVLFTAACNLLRSDRLEQKVAGLKEINE